jgi:hypothetical protein
MNVRHIHYSDFPNQVHLGYSMVFHENLNTHQPWTLIEKYYKYNVVDTNIRFLTIHLKFYHENFAKYIFINILFHLVFMSTLFRNYTLKDV